MKALSVLIALIFFKLSSAQVFDVEAIKDTGSTDKLINIVILGDGYQESELDQFIIDATNFSNGMFNRSPFSEYANYFNVYAIKVLSNESGVDHPATATDTDESGVTPIFVDTYFNITYDSFGFHRLLFYETDGNNTNNSEAKITNVLANNFPNYDVALIISNTSDFGGSGGLFPVTYNGFWFVDVALHELSHSLFNLKDEYFPIDEALAVEAINMTQETDPNKVKWKNWININNVGIYQHTDSNGNSKPWYRPHQNCKMRSIDKPFCSVCKEGMIEKIHDLVSPIDNYIPNNTTINNPTGFPLSFELSLIKPIPNSLESTWMLNTNSYATNTDSVSLLESELVEGSNTLSVVVTDNNTLLKVDNHENSHTYTITWTINYSTLGVETIESKINRYAIALYPNPAKDIVNFKIESDAPFNLKVEITGLDGKKIKTLQRYNYNNQEINISDLSLGIYTVNFYNTNSLIASKKLVKN